MKIYNEVVIDMNPESSSYGETLHEDSYEYEGDMMLCDWTEIVYDNTDSDGNRWTIRYNIGNFNSIDDIQIFKNGTLDISGTKMGGGLKANLWTRADALAEAEAYLDNIGATGRIPTQEYNEDSFTYTAGEFDPTSSEFRESVESAGGFGEIAKGYGQDPMNFDEFYGAPLKHAKEQYGTGMESLASKTGQNLYDINRQTEEAKVTSGLESSGQIDYTSKRAQTGVFGDYLTQQKELSEQLAFQTEDFWKTTEDQFYAELDENVGAG